MAQTEEHAFNPKRVVRQLLPVFIASAVSVFGLLFQQMFTHVRGFDGYAFEYWAPRALGVVLVTTLLGVVVMNRGCKARCTFGLLGGLFVSFFYIWITN